MTDYMHSAAPTCARMGGGILYDVASYLNINRVHDLVHYFVFSTNNPLHDHDAEFRSETSSAAAIGHRGADYFGEFSAYLW